MDTTHKFMNTVTGIAYDVIELCFIYIAGDGLWDGLRAGFLSFTEIESRGLSPSLCNVNMFCIVQCSHRAWNPNPSLYLSPSPSM